MFKRYLFGKKPPIADAPEKGKNMESALLFTNIIFFTLFNVLPAYFCARFARAIFISKKRNPTSGVIIGVIVGLIFGPIGLVVLWLIQGRTIEKSKRYPLYRGGPDRLEVRWTYGIKILRVFYDDIELGQITGVKDAKKGKKFKLPDGSELSVKIVFGEDLLVNPDPLPALELNGKQIPNSTNDPAIIVGRSAKLFVIGGISTIISAGIGFLTDSYNQYEDYNQFALLIGIVALICGIYIRRRSRIAFFIGNIVALLSIASFCSAVGANEEYLESLFDFYGAINFYLGLRKIGSALTELEKEKMLTTK